MVNLLVVDVRFDMDELTVHWIVSDCDLGKVSVYTPSKGCVGLYVVRIINMC